MSPAAVLTRHLAGQLASSVLRQALLDGPAGADPAPTAMIGLLDAAGLLACPAFADWCVELALDVDHTLLYADLLLDRLASMSAGDSPVQLDPTARRLLATAVTLVDLGAEIRELEPAARRIALTALTAFLQALTTASDSASRTAAEVAR